MREAVALFVGLVGCAVGSSDAGTASSFGPPGASAEGSGNADEGLDPSVPTAEGSGTGDGNDSTGGGDATSAPSDDSGVSGDPPAGSTSSEPLPGECGNGVAESAEACDGRDLAGASCADFDFDDGVLACGAECEVLTEGCFTCGDGQIALAETCDGTNLDGETCQTQGFGSGTLACSADCHSLVTTGCQPLPSCGDGVLNGGEQCDGASLGGNTCVTQGYDLGTLACTASCVLDVSGCMDDTTNCGGQGDFCIFSEDDPQSTCCPPGVNGNVIGICDVFLCV